MENTQQQPQLTQQPKNPNEVDQNQVQNQKKENPSAEVDPKKEVKKRPFVIGVIVNGFNLEDIKYYNKQFVKINKLYKERVKLVFFGYDQEIDKINALEGVSYEYVKSVSIIHYFKQLKALKIDLLFIPLIRNLFNHTTENYNKFLELGLYSIPVITPDIYPYNVVIRDKQNGFIFGNREQFIPYLIDLLSTSMNIGLVKLCGNHAKEEILRDYSYSTENTSVVSRTIGFHDEDIDDEEDENESEGENNDTNVGG